MARFNNPLDHVKVASPCSADWDAMIGNERSRFCGQCKLNVYNLSSMTRAEAEHLIASAEGRLCVRFYRRADGSILTENCPVGLRAVRRRMKSVARAISTAVLSFLAGVGFAEAFSTVTFSPQRTMGTMVREGNFVPTPTKLAVETPDRGMMVMGDIATSSPDETEATRHINKERTEATR